MKNINHLDVVIILAGILPFLFLSFSKVTDGYVLFILMNFILMTITFINLKKGRSK
ncbi:hypothetical protein [Halobacteriovorax sp. JY17]|uniref:hypothetical protein n=1 Tax=Halobacteriovorax sp. JY17 TaxID=2014617 RepID=UPI0025C1CA33|nr:hypothetical protein [Halobacteriovorax sp. JY17]